MAPHMPLTPDQIEFIEELKRRFRVDHRMGAKISELSISRGGDVGVSRITVTEATILTSQTFNPTIRRIIERDGGDDKGADKGKG
jgi:hypothetical protein